MSINTFLKEQLHLTIVDIRQRVSDHGWQRGGLTKENTFSKSQKNKEFKFIQFGVPSDDSTNSSSTNIVVEEKQE